GNLRQGAAQVLAQGRNSRCGKISPGNRWPDDVALQSAARLPVRQSRRSTSTILTSFFSTARASGDVSSISSNKPTPAATAARTPSTFPDLTAAITDGSFFFVRFGFFILSAKAMGKKVYGQVRSHHLWL